jgi:phosphoglycolate phosphatase
VDFDGTLFDTRRAITAAMDAVALKRRGVCFRFDLIDVVIRDGLTLTEMFRTLIPGIDAVELQSWVSDYRDIYNSGLGVRESEPYPYLETVLQTLHVRTNAMYVVSNKGEASVAATLDHHHLQRYFRKTITARGDRSPKPSPESFLEDILPEIAIEAVEQILVIGDTEIDLNYARNIGAASCWASYGYGSPETCLPLGPDHVISDLRDLLLHVSQ